MDKILSIIIPAYNVAPYVEKCIRSCAEQDFVFNDYEIIVVNDGSTDNSPHIIDSIAGDYKNIIVINKKNGGVSSARNTGIDIACGKYVLFLDSDDYLEKHCLSELLGFAIAENLDIVEFGFNNRNDNYELLQQNNLFVHKYSQGDISTGIKYLEENYFTGYSCFYLFKLTCIKLNNIKFNTKIVLHEDELFSLSVLLKSKRVGYYNKIIYNYLRRNSATTSNFKEQHFTSMKEVIIEEISILSFFRSNLFANEIINRSIIRYLKTSIYYNRNIHEILTFLKENGFEKLYKSKANRIDSMMYNISLPFYLYLYSLYAKFLKLLKR